MNSLQDFSYSSVIRHFIAVELCCPCSINGCGFMITSFFCSVVAKSCPYISCCDCVQHYSAVMKYISQGPMLLDVHMHRPHTNSRNFMDALLAFWPGLQVQKLFLTLILLCMFLSTFVNTTYSKVLTAFSNRSSTFVKMYFIVMKLSANLYCILGHYIFIYKVCTSLNYCVF